MKITIIPICSIIWLALIARFGWEWDEIVATGTTSKLLEELDVAKVHSAQNQMLF